MNKIKIGVIFGGMSTEHDVSIVSGKSVLDNLNKNKYCISAIYIDKQGIWYDYFNNNTKISNITDLLNSLDVVFPVLHGLYGEDGTIQGLFELSKIPYVGCGVLASSIAMDKVYSKVVFEKAGLKQARYIYLRKNEENYSLIKSDFSEDILPLDKACTIVEEELKFPVFIKPSNSGSSVGISKAHNISELKEAVISASNFDSKILVEENISGKELECSVLGNNNVKASCIGEILPADEFYSYDAKYNNTNSKTLIPAGISEALAKKIQELAVKAFKSIDGKGFARIDFFAKQDEVYINEINTIPGFTSISMYPKLWEYSGLSYSDLLDELINLALEDK